MKIVLDTNILLVSISDGSPCYWVWKRLAEGAFTLCFTTEILNEYAEIIEEHMGVEVMSQTMDALMEHPHVHFVTKYYHWNLIEIDPDDNKFVDCAIAVNADFIVTQDKHFQILRKVPFPKIEVLNLDQFSRLFDEGDVF